MALKLNSKTSFHKPFLFTTLVIFICSFIYYQFLIHFLFDIDKSSLDMAQDPKDQEMLEKQLEADKQRNDKMVKMILAKVVFGSDEWFEEKKDQYGACYRLRAFLGKPDWSCWNPARVIDIQRGWKTDEGDALFGLETVVSQECEAFKRAAHAYFANHKHHTIVYKLQVKARKKDGIPTVSIRSDAKMLTTLAETLHIGKKGEPAGFSESSCKTYVTIHKFWPFTESIYTALSKLKLPLGCRFKFGHINANVLMWSRYCNNIRQLYVYVRTFATFFI